MKDYNLSKLKPLPVTGVSNCIVIVRPVSLYHVQGPILALYGVESELPIVAGCGQPVKKKGVLTLFLSHKYSHVQGHKKKICISEDFFIF